MPYSVFPQCFPSVAFILNIMSIFPHWFSGQERWTKTSCSNVINIYKCRPFENISTQKRGLTSLLLLIVALRLSNRVVVFGWFVTEMQSEVYIIHVCEPGGRHLTNEAPLGLRGVEKHVHLLTRDIRVQGYSWSISSKQRQCLVSTEKPEGRWLGKEILTI